jgi:hypothetical protein
MYRLPAALLLLCAASAAAEETIWLRGRGSDVWIERNGEMREPRDERKGLTIVSTPARARDDCGATRAWRGAPAGAALLPPVASFVDDGGGPPYDATSLWVYDYGGYPYWLDDWRYRGRDHRHGRHPHFGGRRDRHPFDGDRHQRHRFGGDERRRPEFHRAENSFGGHRHGGRGGHGGGGWGGGPRRDR